MKIDVSNLTADTGLIPGLAIVQVRVTTPKLLHFCSLRLKDVIYLL